MNCHGTLAKIEDAILGMELRLRIRTVVRRGHYVEHLELVKRKVNIPSAKVGRELESEAPKVGGEAGLAIEGVALVLVLNGRQVGSVSAHVLYKILASLTPMVLNQLLPAV
jgi:hypothetical protein